MADKTEVKKCSCYDCRYQNFKGECLLREVEIGKDGQCKNKEGK